MSNALQYNNYTRFVYSNEKLMCMLSISCIVDGTALSHVSHVNITGSPIAMHIAGSMAAQKLTSVTLTKK